MTIEKSVGKHGEYVISTGVEKRWENVGNI